ncbi:unnamed protein product [Allacma fusca]|uniref:Uncharacterized protein n=1 Tax=Allacma fusca TaxID=39272 RepID=A0A8J2PGX8_9HEXA|nr:unnamed protein product [Allacma fusca]
MNRYGGRRYVDGVHDNLLVGTPEGLIISGMDKNVRGHEVDAVHRRILEMTQQQSRMEPKKAVQEVVFQRRDPSVPSPTPSRSSSNTVKSTDSNSSLRSFFSKKLDGSKKSSSTS